MTFLDLSDAEEIFGLFVEFVAEERAGCHGDPERLVFLEGLLAHLTAMESELDQAPLSATVEKLQDLRESVEPGFAQDPVVVHLDDLIEEIQGAGGI